MSLRAYDFYCSDCDRWDIDVADNAAPPDSLECKGCHSPAPRTYKPTGFNAQLTGDSAPILWYDPKKSPDDKSSYRFPMDGRRPMPEYYRRAGYVKHEFKSLREHEAFQKKVGVICHKTWDID